MEIDGTVRVTGTDNVAINIRGRDNGDRSDVNQIQNVLEGNGNEESGANQVITLEPKRKRVEELWADNNVSKGSIDSEASKESGPKNG